MNKYYVLRTDKLTPPRYWCGVAGEGFSVNDVISDAIFDAVDFPTRATANRARKELGADDWTVSECHSEMSPDLAAAMEGTMQ